MISYLVLFFALIFGSSGGSAPNPFDVIDFAAAAPSCYNHKLGGGAWNDGTIGNTNDVVESLQAGDFACDDLVSFFWRVQVKPVPGVVTPFSAQFVLDFLGTTTGQPGLAFAYVNSSTLYFNGTGVIAFNKPGQPVQNGNGCLYGQTCANSDNQCTPPFGAAPKASDSGVNLNGNEKAFILAQQLSAPLFTQKSVLSVFIRYDGLDPGEVLIGRLDVQIKCWPGHSQLATGNLQGAISGIKVMPNAAYGYSTNATGFLINPITVSAGSQTVPLKSGNTDGTVVSCFTVAQTLTGSTFCANIAVTGTGYQNGGIQYGKLYYSWTQGLFVTSIATSPTTYSTSYFTYNPDCTTTHQSGQSYSFGACGCEPVTQYPTSSQPQLFYNNGTQYWCTSDTSVAGQTTWFACPGAAFPYGPTSITLKNDANKTPLKIVWNDGTIYTISDVSFGASQGTCGVPSSPSSTCTSAPVCGRPLDIALLLETSQETDNTDLQAERDFATAFVNSFTVSSSNVQFAVYGFNQSATRYLGLDPTASNVFSAINKVGCTGGCNGKADILNALKTVVGKEFSSNNLRTNSQKVIVLVTRGYDAYTYDPQSIADYIATLPVDANGLHELFVIAVPYEAICTQPNLFAMVTDGDPLNLYQRFAVADLGTTASARDVSQRVCGLAQKADYCGSCCGYCDTSCTSQQCIGVNNCTASPICGQSYVITNASGATCCSVVYGNTCSGFNKTTCQTLTCSPTTQQCSWTGGCAAPSNCIVPTCQETFPGSNDYGCQPVPLIGKPVVGTCDVVVCNAAGTGWQTVSNAASCASSSCVTRSCQLDSNGLNNCIISGSTPDPTPITGTNFCFSRQCNDTTGGWQTVRTTCAPRACFDVTCVNATGCQYTAKTCNDPTNLCDVTQCDITTNNCPTTPTYKNCNSTDPCATCGTCNPSDGTCPQCTVDICCKDPTFVGCSPPTPTPTPTPGVTPTPSPTPTPPPSVCSADCTSDVCHSRTCLEGSATCQTTPVDCTVVIGSLGNQCAKSTGCDMSLPAGQQCTVGYVNCSNFPHPNCTTVVADPDFPGCCKVVPRQCASDLCHTGSCNATTNQCVLNFNCTTTNPCFPGVCGANGCENPAKCSSGISGCTTVSCSPNGTCGTDVKAGCISDDPCYVSTCVLDTTTGASSCQVAPFCPSSSDICNPTTCQVISGKATCVTAPLDCGLPATGCRDAGCDATKGGCYAVPQDGVCQLDACNIGTCNVTDGACLYTPLNCSDPANFPPGVSEQSFCYPLVCDPTVVDHPCQVRINNCTQNYTKVNGSCDIMKCNNATDECELTKSDCFPLVALIAGLAGGAIAGIVIAAVVGALLISGGAGALSTIEITPEETVMSNNPIYQDKGTHGVNALHNAGGD